jgi:hypothetical protein
MNPSSQNSSMAPKAPRKGCLILCGIFLTLLAIILITAGMTVWVVKRQINPGPLPPIVLNAAEQRALDHKIERVKASPSSDTNTVSEAAIPEDRLIEFSEKELNALIARSTDLDDTVRVDLEEDEIFARMHVPVPGGSPVLSGKTLSIGLRLTCSLRNGEPHLILRKITIGGISLPNAWTGYRKNTNLMGQAANLEPEMLAFLDGVEEFSLEKDRLRIVLKK